MVIQLPLSLGLALLLNRRMRGRAVLRLLVFAPYVLSEAVTAVIWLSLLQPGGRGGPLDEVRSAWAAWSTSGSRTSTSCSTRCSW